MANDRRPLPVSPAPHASPDGLLRRVTLGLLGKPKSAATAAPSTHVSRLDSTREIVETVVFVVVLVLLLKSFVAEAFVIPTGSMAETLWGYQKVIECPKCGHQFPVNASEEVDPPDAVKKFVEAATCPNCRHQLANLTASGPAEGAGRRLVQSKIESNTGDRVLVAKFLYDLPWRSPRRLETVVFKFPKEPQKNYVPMNYIKRLIGLPGETIAIHYGNIYILDPQKGLKYDDRDVKPEDLWQKQYLHEDDAEALRLFAEGKFEILRKPPDQILAMRRIVYDNDHPAFDLRGQPPRWAPEEGASWTPVPADNGFAAGASSDDRLTWLRYHHLVKLREGNKDPQLITDFTGYNAFVSVAPQFDNRETHNAPQEHWVGDLILECEVKVETASGQFVLELARGADRFRAVWALDSGVCTLRQIEKHEERAAPADDAGEQLSEAKTSLKGPGTYRVRFANVDDRLVVWVKNDLPFGDGVAYTPSGKPGPRPNDLEPAGVGVRGGAVQVRHLKLWRDTYYTTNPNQGGDFGAFDAWGDPARWDSLRGAPPKTLYVHPGHYLCMGDNSPASSDGRSWGLVPQRLMLGRALVVYYPFYFPWPPLGAPVNRVGTIK